MDTNNSLAICLNRLFDYAGMFPPAKRSFEEALKEHSTFASTLNRPWILGADIVLEQESLATLAKYRNDIRSNRDHFLVCALATGDLAALKAAFLALAQSESNQSVSIKPAAIEIKTTSASLDSILGQFGEYSAEIGALLAVEPDLSGEDWSTVLNETVGKIGKRCPTAALKCRLTGPTGIGAERLAAAIALVADAGLAFKVTGGLHHPIPEPGLHNFSIGFLNVSAALWLRAALDARLPEDEMVKLLGCGDLSELSFSPEGLRYKQHQISIERLQEVRKARHFSIGSCSLHEPDQDLSRLELLL